MAALRERRREAQAAAPQPGGDPTEGAVAGEQREHPPVRGTRQVANDLGYRFVVAEGGLLSADFIQKCYNEFAGLNDPVPKTTVTQAAAKGASKKTATPSKAAGGKKSK